MLIAVQLNNVPVVLLVGKMVFIGGNGKTAVMNIKEWNSKEQQQVKSNHWWLGELPPPCSSSTHAAEISRPKLKSMVHRKALLPKSKSKKMLRKTNFRFLGDSEQTVWSLGNLESPDHIGVQRSCLQPPTRAAVATVLVKFQFVLHLCPALFQREIGPKGLPPNSFQPRSNSSHRHSPHRSPHYVHSSLYKQYLAQGYKAHISSCMGNKQISKVPARLDFCAVCVFGRVLLFGLCVCVCGAKAFFFWWASLFSISSLPTVRTGSLIFCIKFLANQQLCCEIGIYIGSRLLSNWRQSRTTTQLSANRSRCFGGVSVQGHHFLRFAVFPMNLFALVDKLTNVCFEAWWPSEQKLNFSPWFWGEPPVCC